MRFPDDQFRFSSEFPNASSVQQDGISTAAKVAYVLGFIVVLGAVVGGVSAAGENEDPESFKSSKTVAEGVGIGALVAIPFTAVIVGLIAFWCLLLEECSAA